MRKLEIVKSGITDYHNVGAIKNWDNKLKGKYILVIAEPNIKIFGKLIDYCTFVSIKSNKIIYNEYYISYHFNTDDIVYLLDKCEHILYLI